MRARSIKPGICDNELLGTVDPFITLLFERLWMMADREGRLEDRPLRIKAQAFPYRDGLDVEPMLAWLKENGFIVRYVVGGQRFIQVAKFAEHQRPHANESASKIPSPDQSVTDTDEESTTKVASPSDQGGKYFALNPSSLNPSSLTADISARDGGIRFGQFERQPESGLDAWREVEGIDPAAMAEWLEHLGGLDPPKRLNAMTRVACAKQLAGYGDRQLAIVRGCAGNGWRNLRETGPPTNGTHGGKPSVTETLARLRAQADAAGEPEF